jgi:hypothetical protein
VGAAVIGTVAERTGPATAMTVAGVASLLVTLALWSRLRPLSGSREKLASPAG